MRIDLNIPLSWQELTLDQLRDVVVATSGSMNKNEALIYLFCRFAGVKMAGKSLFATADGRKFRMEAWQLADICKKLEYIFTDMPCDTVPPISVNRHLVETSFDDYFYADSMILKFRQTQDVNDMLEAVKALGDKRKSLDEIECGMMLIWWGGIQQWLKGEYPDVFSGGEGESDGYNPFKTRQNIMLMLNDNRPQDNERIGSSNMHDVLAALDNKIKQAKEIERQMKKH